MRIGKRPPVPRAVNGVIRVDIHEMYPSDAKKYLERLLAGAGEEVERVEIIHGYHSGQALMQVVRSEVRSRKIKRRGLDLNPGVTVYYLK